MAGNIEEVGLRLQVQGARQAAAQIEQPTEAITEMGAEAERTGTRTKRAFVGIGTAIKATLAVAATGGAVFVGLGVKAARSLLGIGIGYNDLEQKSRAAFTTLLGTTDAAEQMMSDIREFGKTSPFPRQAFIAGTQQLLGFGFAAKDIIPLLTTINDAVAATGGGAEDIAGLTNVFASIKAQGKITGEEINRLSDMGIDAVAMLATAGNTSGEAIRKAISEGAIGADDAIAVLTAGMNSRFAGASENVKKTWSGAKDRVVGAWRDIGSVLAEPFVDPQGGGMAVDWANKLADQLRIIEGKAPAVMAAIGSGAFLARTGSNLSSDASAWERIGFALGKAQSALRGVDWAGILSSISGALSSISWDGIQAFFSALVGSGPTAGTQLSSLSGSMTTLAPAAQAFADSAPTLSDVLTIMAGVMGFLADHVDTLVTLMPYLVGAYVAYRVALLTAVVAGKSLQIIQASNTIATWRSIAANRALAASNAQLAAAINGTTGANSRSTGGLVRNTIAWGRNGVAVAAAKAKAGGAWLLGLIASIGRGTVALARNTAAWVVSRTVMVAGAIATGAMTAAQWLLNSAFFANPIGLVVLAIAALVGGLILAYQKSDTFRGIVDKLWAGIKTLWQWVKDLGSAFKTWLIDKIVDAIGWVQKLVDKIDGVPVLGGLISGAMSAVSGGAIEARAGGGPVSAGKPYVVGEKQPELFVPRQAGTIIPRVPDLAADADGASLSASVGETGDLHIHQHIDGREVGVTVIKDFRRQKARL